MSYRKVSGFAAIMGTAFALAGTAYAEPGKSPNGPPGPEGNPNQPTAQPQANGPQGPAGNEQHGKSQARAQEEAKAPKAGSKPAPKSKSKPAPRSKSRSNHANPNPGTPRKGGREDRPAGKITICHATRSEKNPYVEITISVNGLNGHGPAEDPHHHAGSWKDIIPAPAGGCPTTVQPATEQAATTQESSPTTTTPPTGAPAFAPAVEFKQVVLGAQAEGTTPVAATDEPKSAVLGASAEGETAPAADVPAAAVAAREVADEDGGSLPFTGFELAFLLVLGGAALLGGFAVRRATRSNDI
jgi:hypothetical protein